MPEELARRVIGREHARWGVPALLGVLGLVIVAGWGVLLASLDHGFGPAVERRVLSNAAETAERWGGRVSEHLAGGVDRDVALQELQAEVAEVFSETGTVVWLLDADGQVVGDPCGGEGAHEDEHDLESVRLLIDGQSLRLSELGPELVVATALTADNEREPVATMVAPGTSIRVLVNPGEEALIQTGHAVIQLALHTTGALVMLIALIVAVLIIWVFRRYSRMMGHANAALQEELNARIGDILRARNSLIFGLAKLADYRDNDTGDHLERIAGFVVLLAERLRDMGVEGIDAPWIANLRLASSLHDIGKVGIPDAILLKPGRLTDQERRIIERHTLLGADTLIAIRREYGDDVLIDLSCQVALYHHERWNGERYPFGFEGESIPLAARIVSVADVYDALTSERVYKAAMPHDKAVELIREGAGTQFDPVVVAAFLSVEGEFERLARESRENAEPELTLCAA